MLNYVSLFEQEWWYSAATDGRWEQVEYSFGPYLGAKLIFVTRKRRGVAGIDMPPLARVMQPVISYGPGRPKDELQCNVRLIKGVSDLLPPHDEIRYCLPPGSDLELAYCLSGYSVSPSYTFQTDPQRAHDTWAKMDIKVRSNIKRGAKRMGIEAHDDISRYIRLSMSFMKHRAFTDIVDYDAISRIWEACHARKQAAILSCVGTSGQDLASTILLWDERYLYYWMNCRNPDQVDGIANSVLIWNAIEFAAKAGLVFDIDGFSTPTAGIFKSRFGLLPRRRINVSRISSAARLRSALSSHVVEMVGPQLKRKLLKVRNTFSHAAAA